MNLEPQFNNARLQEVIEHSQQVVRIGKHHVMLLRSVHVLHEELKKEHPNHPMLAAGYEYLVTYHTDWINDFGGPSAWQKLLCEFMSPPRALEIDYQLAACLALIAALRKLFEDGVLPAMNLLIKVTMRAGAQHGSVWSALKAAEIDEMMAQMAAAFNIPPAAAGETP